MVAPEAGGRIESKDDPTEDREMPDALTAWCRCLQGGAEQCRGVDRHAPRAEWGMTTDCMGLYVILIDEDVRQLRAGPDYMHMACTLSTADNSAANTDQTHLESSADPPGLVADLVMVEEQQMA